MIFHLRPVIQAGAPTCAPTCPNFLGRRAYSPPWYSQVMRLLTLHTCDTRLFNPKYLGACSTGLNSWAPNICGRAPAGKYFAGLKSGGESNISKQRLLIQNSFEHKPWSPDDNFRGGTDFEWPWCTLKLDARVAHRSAKVMQTAAWLVTYSTRQSKPYMYTRFTFLIRLLVRGNSETHT